MSVWRLKQKDGSMGMTFEIAHQEMLPPSPFQCKRLFISEKYIVSQFERGLDSEERLIEMMIEVRSAVDFAVIHTFETHIRSTHLCRFYNDILAISLYRQGEPTIIR